MYWHNSVDDVALPGIQALAKEPKGAPTIPCQNAVLDLFVIEWNGLRIAVRDTCSKSG
jgi:hypothetical protein